MDATSVTGNGYDLRFRPAGPIHSQSLCYTNIGDVDRGAGQSVLGVPRIHGELLKLGVDVGPGHLGTYLAGRPKAPFATWRSFLHNRLTDTVGSTWATTHSINS
jgi:hypothetical protein